MTLFVSSELLKQRKRSEKDLISSLKDEGQKKRIILKAKSTLLLNLCERHFILGQGLQDAINKRLF